MPRNILKRYGSCYELKNIGSSSAQSKIALSFDVQKVQTSLIKIEVETDGRLTFIRNLATGVVDSLSMYNNGFESMTQTGVLTALIRNTDIITGSFLVQVSCSESSALLISPPSQSFSLAAGETKSLNFSVSESSREASNHNCTVSLLDPEGTILDSKSL